MKQPDRFDKMVGQVRWSDPDIPVMMLRLLRRQHAAYVRMVEQMSCVFAGGSRACVGNQDRCSLSRGDLLAAMERYQKGTR